MSDFAGWAVSLSSDGHNVAVGYPTDDDGGANAGHVRVFYAEATIRCGDVPTKKWTKKGETCESKRAWIEDNKKKVSASGVFFSFPGEPSVPGCLV